MAASKFIVNSLRPYQGTVLLGHLLSVVLGLVSAAMVTVVGPAFQMLMNPSQSSVSLEALFGSFLGSFFSRISGVESLTEHFLFGVMPQIVVCIAFFKMILSIAQWYLWENLGEVVSFNTRREIAERFLQSSSAKQRIENSQVGDRLAAAVGNDIRLLREYIVHFLGGLPREGLQVLFQGLLLILLDAKLFLIFLFGLTPVVILISRVGKKIKKRTEKVLNDFSGVAEWVQQRLLGVETIKHYRSEEFEVAGFSKQLADLYDRQVSAAHAKFRVSPLVEFIGLCAFAIVLALALQSSVSGQQSGAVLVTFFTSLAFFAQSAGRLGKYLNSNRAGRAGVERIESLLTDLKRLELGSSQSDVEILEGNRNCILCKDVSFAYLDNDVVKNFSFEFQQGKMTCIVGRSGSGKSTLFRLLLGLERPKSGVIQFVTSNVKHPLPVCYVPQSTILAPDQIARNVSYPFLDYDLSGVERVLSDVGLLDFMRSLKDGIRTDARVAGLSGGQIQRIFLARVLYHSSPFVLIDEGTSALDPETEAQFMRVLETLKARNACIVMITHREKIRAMADAVVELKS